ncbi:hypothetical protein GGR57DRAFT_383138 [Xylariaceae sp. FL1272]|nr:hypothetical protein GGR57DRAFT_383138 [Xylariaceae sp. FL1272]
MMERDDSTSQSPQPQPQSQSQSQALSRSHSHQASRPRPPIGRHHTSDSQVTQTSSENHSHTRQKHQKHVVGGGTGRSRVPPSKLHRQQSSQSSTKLNRRAPSPDPSPDPYRLPMLNNNNNNSNSNSKTHRRAHSDLRLTSHDTSNHQQSSHPNLASKRNRSHVEIGKRPKTTSNIKRSSSHKEVNKLKGQKAQVHFDLGNDGNDDEWVDASATASPYLSRRGSVMSSSQSPAKPSEDEKETEDDEHDTEDKRPHTPPNPDPRDSSPSRETSQHNHRITSRLLQRTPSHGAPPQMSTETAAVPPPSGSPTLAGTRSGPPSLFGTPKTSTLGASGPEELTSRFVNGDGSAPGSNGNRNSGYFVPAHVPVSISRTEDLRRPRSLIDLTQNRRDSTSDDENGTALAPRSSRSRQPASQSRTQQKLNLQRASSSMEPTQVRAGAGGAGVSLLVGSSDYEDRDPRIGKLLERTGMEYLVVRRYQNPIARSIARLSHLPGAHKNQRIPKQNGANGTHSKAPSESGRLGLSQSMSDVTRSRPVTPRRSTSIRTTGARSSYDADEERTLVHDEQGGANGDEIAALLRNLWDKNNLDLSASQD